VGDARWRAHPQTSFHQGQTVTTLASQQLWIGLGIVGFLFVSLTMILIVLIQKPQGGGLSGAFGSSSDGGAGQTAFGAKTGDVLTTLTISIFIVFLVSAAGLNYVVRPSAAPVEEEASTAAGADGSESTPGIRTESGETINLTPGEGPIPGLEEGEVPAMPPSDSPPAPPTVDPDLDMPPADGTPEG
jgi:preprotein translocase subunit SecG